MLNPNARNMISQSLIILVEGNGHSAGDSRRSPPRTCRSFLCSFCAKTNRHIGVAQTRSELDRVNLLFGDCRTGLFRVTHTDDADDHKGRQAFPSHFLTKPHRHELNIRSKYRGCGQYCYGIYLQ